MPPKEQNLEQATIEELILQKATLLEEINHFTSDLRKAQMKVTSIQLKLMEKKKAFDVIERKIWKIKLSEKEENKKKDEKSLTKKEKNSLEEKLDLILKSLPKEKLEEYLEKLKGKE